MANDKNFKVKNGIDSGGVITATVGNSTEWSTAYTYSQVGHLPLAGGTLTGRLIVENNIGDDASWTGGILIRNTGAVAGEPAIAFQNTAMGSNYWILGSNQDNEFHFGYGSVFQDANTKVLIKPDGKVGINRGTGEFSNHLEVGGNILATGTVTATGGNSTNWNTAYTYSQAGHLPLAGGTLTGDLVFSGSRAIQSNFFDLDFYTNGTVPLAVGRLELKSGGKTGWAAGDEHGAIEWYVDDGSGVGARTAARIVAVNNQGNGVNTTTFEGDLAFYTSAYNAFVNSSPALLLKGDNTATFVNNVNINIGALQLGGTTVIDSSRNLTNIGTITASGEITANGGIALGDNDKATFGASDDLQIFHDGYHSIIAENGAGSLLIRGDNTYFTNSAGTKGYADFVTDGAVILRNNNLQKLATTATGIDVTGTVVADGLTVNGTSRINQNSGTLEFRSADGTSNGYNLKASVNNTSDFGFFIEDKAGKDLLKVASSGDVSFYEDTGTTAKLTWSASGEDLNFADNVKATFGASDDLQIYHNGNNSFIEEVGTGNFYLRAANNIFIQGATANESMATFQENGFVKLFFNNSEKLATTATGIDVTGTATMDGLVVDGNSSLQTTSVGQLNISGLTKITGVRGTFVDPSEDPSIPNIFATNDAVGDFSQEAGHLVIQPRVHPTVFRDVIFAGGAGTTKRLMTIQGEGDISFYEDTGTTAKFFWDASEETLFVDQKIKVGNTTDGVVLQTSTGLASIIGTDTGGNGWNALDIRAGSSTQLYLNTSGNVGIGTSSPSAGLQVAKGSSTIPAAGASTSSACFGNDASDDNYGVVVGANSNGVGYISSQRTDGTATTYNLSIQPNGGNVGIGTSSPASVLDVSGEAPTLTLRDSRTGGSWTAGTALGKLDFYTSDSTGIGAHSIASIGVVAGGANTASPDGELVFATGPYNIGSTERMRIDSAGAVTAYNSFRAPIFYDSNNTGYYVDPNGTSNVYALGVGGTTVIDSSRNLTNIGTISSADDITTLGNIKLNRADGFVYLNNQGTGNAGIYVRGITSSSTLRSHSTNNFRWEVTGSQKMELNSSGVLNAVGGYQVNGTTVIDSSRNLTNIGTIQGTGNLNIKRSSDGATALQVLSTGEVIVGSNYLYVTAGAGSYFSNAARFRGGISNDTGDLSLADDVTVGGNFKINGTTVIDSSRNLTNIGAISNPSIWINDGTSTGSWNENIRLYDTSQGVSTIAFGAAAGSTSGTPRHSFVSYSDNLSFYYGGSIQEYKYNGYSLHTGSYRAPIFYDSNNTGFYLDPAASSKVNEIYDISENAYRSYRQSQSDFPNGTLVITSIDASAVNGASVRLEAKGKSYSGLPSMSFTAEAYLYNNTFINVAGLHTGSYGFSNMVIMNYNGYIAFWWPRVSYWNSFDVAVINTSSGNSKNSVTSIINAADPTGSAKRVNIPMKMSAIYGTNHNDSLYASIVYDSNNTGYYVDPNTTGTSVNVAGSIIAGGNITAYSDRRVKENIEPITSALNKVQQLNGVTFNRIDLSDKTKRYAGLIAQDIEKVLPEAVDDDVIKRVDYNATIGLLVEAIKELKTEVDNLKTQLAQKEQ